MVLADYGGSLTAEDFRKAANETDTRSDDGRDASRRYSCGYCGSG